MARYRFRDLTSRADPKGVHRVIQARRREAMAEYEGLPLPLQVMAADVLMNNTSGVPFSAAGDAPRLVDAVDGEADELQLVAALLEGDLEPRDLVFMHGGWMSFEDAPGFADVCAVVRRRARKKRALIIAAVTVALAVLAFLRFR